MRPRRVLPPELYWPGTRPSQAASCRPFLKSRALPIVATSARGGACADALQLHQPLRCVQSRGHRLMCASYCVDALVDRCRLR